MVETPVEIPMPPIRIFFVLFGFLLDKGKNLQNLPISLLPKFFLNREYVKRKMSCSIYGEKSLDRWIAGSVDRSLTRL